MMADIPSVLSKAGMDVLGAVPSVMEESGTDGMVDNTDGGSHQRLTGRYATCGTPGAGPSVATG